MRAAPLIMSRPMHRRPSRRKQCWFRFVLVLALVLSEWRATPSLPTALSPKLLGVDDCSCFLHQRVWACARDGPAELRSSSCCQSNLLKLAVARAPAKRSGRDQACDLATKQLRSAVWPTTGTRRKCVSLNPRNIDNESGFPSDSPSVRIFWVKLMPTESALTGRIQHQAWTRGKDTGGTGWNR